MTFYDVPYLKDTTPRRFSRTYYTKLPLELGTLLPELLQDPSDPRWDSLVAYALGVFKGVARHHNGQDEQQRYLLKVVGKLPTFQGHHLYQLGEWLRTLLQRMRIDDAKASRAEKRRHEEVTDDVLAWADCPRTATPEEILLACEEAELVLADLDEREAEMFELLHVQGLTVAEAGARFGLSPSGAEKRAARLRRKMRVA